MFTSSYSLKKTMAQPTIGISQRLLLQLFSVGYIRWIEDTWPLRMYQPSPIRSRKDGVPSFSKNGRISLGERFDRLHALTDLLYISFLSQHFTDNLTNNVKFKVEVRCLVRFLRLFLRLPLCQISIGKYGRQTPIV